MKQHIGAAIKLTFISLLLFSGLYTLVILGIAQFAPNKGQGETVLVNGKVRGYLLEGQYFSHDNYFWGRPSAAAYNAMASAGSNKGPSNPDYLKDVQSRIDSFMLHNPGVTKEEIPAELVTYSGSGLDPHLSPQGIYVQVKRVARARNMSEDRLMALVDSHRQRPFLGLFGTPTVNVLELNLALDNLK